MTTGVRKTDREGRRWRKATTWAVLLVVAAVLLSGCVGLQDPQDRNTQDTRNSQNENLSETVQRVPEDVDYVVRIDGDVFEDESTGTVARTVYDVYRRAVEEDSLYTRGYEGESLPEGHTEYIQEETGLPDTEGLDEIVLVGSLDDPSISNTALISSNWTVDEVLAEMEHDELNVTERRYKGVEVYDANATFAYGTDEERNFTVARMAHFGDGDFAVSGSGLWRGTTGYGGSRLNRTEDVIDVHVGDEERFSGELEEGFRRVDHGLVGFALTAKGTERDLLDELSTAEGFYSTEEGDVVSETRLRFDSSGHASNVSSSLNEALLEVESNEDVRNVTFPVRVERNGREINVSYRTGAVELAEGIETIADSGF